MIILVFGVVSKLWFLCPPFMGIAALLHLVFVGVFSISGEKKLMIGFLAGFLVTMSAAVLHYLVLKTWFPLVFDAYAQMV